MKGILVNWVIRVSKKMVENKIRKYRIMDFYEVRL